MGHAVEDLVAAEIVTRSRVSPGTPPVAATGAERSGKAR